jgi:hypothetical protein
MISSAMQAELARKPGWRDECVKLLKDFIKGDRIVARSNYAEWKTLKFNDAIWERADPVGYALVKRARDLIQRAHALRIYIVRND